jgi:hypothetical protein
MSVDSMVFFTMVVKHGSKFQELAQMTRFSKVKRDGLWR